MWWIAHKNLIFLDLLCSSVTDEEADKFLQLGEAEAEQAASQATKADSDDEDLVQTSHFFLICFC